MSDQPTQTNTDEPKIVDQGGNTKGSASYKGPVPEKPPTVDTSSKGNAGSFGAR